MIRIGKIYHLLVINIKNKQLIQHNIKFSVQPRGPQHTYYYIVGRSIPLIT